MVSSAEVDALYQRWLAMPEEDRYSFVMGSLPEASAMALLRHMSDLRSSRVNCDPALQGSSLQESLHVMEAV